MQVFFSDIQLRHAPREFLVRGQWKPCPEAPARATALRAALLAEGHQISVPPVGDRGAIAAVHDARYLAFLQTAHQRWRELPDASDSIVPNIHPNGRGLGYPRSVVGQASFYTCAAPPPVLVTGSASS